MHTQLTEQLAFAAAQVEVLGLVNRYVPNRQLGRPLDERQERVLGAVVVGPSELTVQGGVRDGGRHH